MSNPAAFNAGRYSALTSSKARAMPSFAASAWPLTPPPEEEVVEKGPRLDIDEAGGTEKERGGRTPGSRTGPGANRPGGNRGGAPGGQRRRTTGGPGGAGRRPGGGR